VTDTTPIPPGSPVIPGPADPHKRRRDIAVLFAIGILCLLAFGLLATWLRSNGWISPFDLRTNVALRNARTPWLTALMWIVSLPGDAPVITPLTAIVAVVLALWGWRSGALLLVASLTAEGVIQTAIAASFARHRPPAQFALVQRLSPYSFPSGHAWSVLLFTGLVGLVLWRTLSNHWLVRVTILSTVTAIAGLVGASRVYLGVHWPTDVIAGWIMAVFTLVVSGAIYLWAVKRFHFRERGVLWGSAAVRLAVTALAILLVVGLLAYDMQWNPLVPGATKVSCTRALDNPQALEPIIVTVGVS
jgi:undecaprenyl-diphosphatase